MITAIDTNVLLDVWLADPKFGEDSLRALVAADEAGDLIVCDAVYAELASCRLFESQAALDAKFEELEIKVTPMPRAAAYHAGVVRRRYMEAGGKRVRILPDFLVAAHAQFAADRLLSRDDGFLRTYFPKLAVNDPSKRR